MSESKPATAIPASGTISIVPADLPPVEAYRLFISALVPRPIAWVSTKGADGSLNLAPFSFFNAVGGIPPTIMISIASRKGEMKDTLRNLYDTGEMVVHIVDESLAAAMNVTSGDYPYGTSEFELAGLTAVPSVDVKPPRLAEAAIAMEARVLQFIPVADTRYTAVFARVLRFHLRHGLIRSSGLVDTDSLKPVGRLGGNEYARMGNVFSMPRPEVAPPTGR